MKNAYVLVTMIQNMMCLYNEDEELAGSPKKYIGEILGNCTKQERDPAVDRVFRSVCAVKFNFFWIYFDPINVINL